MYQIPTTERGHWYVQDTLDPYQTTTRLPRIWHYPEGVRDMRIWAEITPKRGRAYELLPRNWHFERV